jgi:hypothetical protein|tara:strand:+ start:1591 stop:2637 length:1047 start_codon:yes stop_codon:yes gene_type:complete
VSTLYNRIKAFEKLGILFSNKFTENSSKESEYWTSELDKAIDLAYKYNTWFTEDSVKKALNEWSKQLNYNSLKNWTDQYKIEDKSEKKIAIIMAGNLPLVGFHDLLCGLIMNFHCIVKLSSDDKILIPFIVEYLDSIVPGIKNQVKFTTNPIKDFNGVIATGSNNSFKYFEYYFGNYPNLLRKTRHSIAVLDGKETEMDLKKLGNDIFTYFGMGCRSVSKLLVPKGYDFDLLFNALFDFKEIINHNKYVNNYDYNKAVYLMSEQKFIENGFIILKEDEKLGSPIGCLFFEYYENPKDLNAYISDIKDSLQCVVSNLNILNSTSFGSSQSPKIDDYADNTNTLDFLLKI